MNLIKKTCVSLGLVSLVGCASMSDYPGWVDVPDEWQASSCVSFSGVMSADRKQAVQYATADLSKQLEVQVAGLVKSALEKTESSQGTNVGQNFSEASRGFFRQTMRGVRPVDAGTYQIANKDMYCVLVAMPEENVKAAFDSSLDQAKAQLSSKDESILFERFRAQQLDQELQKERNK